MYSSAGILSSAGYSDADAKTMDLHVIKFELRFTFIHPWLGRLKWRRKEKTPGTISLMMLSRPSSYRSCQIVPSLNSILNPCRLSYRSCQIVPSLNSILNPCRLSYRSCQIVFFFSEFFLVGFTFYRCFFIITLIHMQSCYSPKQDKDIACSFLINQLGIKILIS